MDNTKRSSEKDFDFILGSWRIQNRRRTQPLNPENSGVWEEFDAFNVGEKYLDGRVIIDRFEGRFPNGEVRKGITIRAFDETSQKWSLVWLDNQNPHDFVPLVGTFENGVGRFLHVTQTPNGETLHVRFTWDGVSDESARWQQEFSFDGGDTWDRNWVMEFRRDQSDVSTQKEATCE